MMNPSFQAFLPTFSLRKKKLTKRNNWNVFDQTFSKSLEFDQKK